VAPEKGELSHVVVKGVRVQSDNVHVTPFVFGMTMLAVGGRDVRDGAMKAALSGDIFIDVLMTKKAQIVLPAFLETAMTLVTVLFELGVTLNDRPWHH
jgi:hypothetical protein